LVVFIFVPIEQVCYNLFSRLFSDFYIESSKFESIDNTSATDSKKPDKIVEKFCTVIKYLMIFGGLLIAYGVPYSKALISICFGARWSTPEMISS